MAEQIIKGLSRKLFRSLITLNLALTLGMLLFAAFSMQLSSVVFTGVFFLLALVTYVAGEWHDVWTLKNTKITTYLLVTAVLILKLFASSDSLLVFIIIDIILVEVLFNRYVAVLREQQNRFPLYLITVALFVVFIDEVTNFVHPNIFNASVTMEVLIFGFVIVKLLFTSAMLFVESKRSATQRLKEEQFIDYSADFNNFFSHYINTPLTTVMSNIEIVRFKLGKKADSEILELVERNFSVVNQGLENISKTTRELSNIHYIRSEILRNGNDSWFMEESVSQLISRFNAELEQVIDTWPKVFAPKAMVLFTLEHILVNAASYGTDETRARVVVHEEPEMLVLSTFNKGNVPNFEVDVLQPFQRGENVIEGTGTGLGLSLVPDLLSDYGCSFTLTNIGGFTRAQLKIPLDSPSRVLPFESSGLPSKEPNTDPDDSTVQGHQAHTR